MSEDHDEDGQAMGPFILPIPEQIQQQIRAQHDHALMAGEVWRHEVRTFFDGLTEEQALTFKGILRNISDAEEPTNLANFWEGMISFMIDVKFGVCVGCGKNHDEDMAAMTQETDGPGDLAEGS